MFLNTYKWRKQFQFFMLTYLWKLKMVMWLLSWQFICIVYLKQEYHEQLTFAVLVHHVGSRSGVPIKPHCKITNVVSFLVATLVRKDLEIHLNCPPSYVICRLINMYRPQTPLTAWEPEQSCAICFSKANKSRIGFFQHKYRCIKINSMIK